MGFLVFRGRAVFDVGAVFRRKEASNIGLRGPLDERYLGEDSVAADAGYYGVDSYSVARLVTNTMERRRAAGDCGHRYMLF